MRGSPLEGSLSILIYPGGIGLHETLDRYEL
jgi:hypothetical protein